LACGLYTGKINVYGLYWRALSEYEPLEDVSVDGRKILKYILKTRWGTDWINLAWIGTSRELS
jgi:hypothetical protein